MILDFTFPSERAEVANPNDVPISTIARGIEIDLLQMLDENPEDIPSQFPEEQNVQM